MPVGYALGYIFGGIVGVALGWRAAFMIEALAMVPAGLFCLLAPPIDLRGTHARAPSGLMAQEYGSLVCFTTAFKGRSFSRALSKLKSSNIHV